VSTDREPDDATRRTLLAQERTVLAWWRSALTALAVAIGVGRLIPVLLDLDPGPFILLGIGFAALGLAYVIAGSIRDRAVTKALSEGSFTPMGAGLLWTLTAALAALAVATLVLIVTTGG
jgi:putative membrane protein